MEAITNKTVYHISLRKMGFIGWVIMMIGFVFALIETSYFHSFYLPATKNEFICDFIATFFVGAGSGIYLYSIATKFILTLRELKTKL